MIVFYFLALGFLIGVLACAYCIVAEHLQIKKIDDGDPPMFVG